MIEKFMLFLSRKKALRGLQQKYRMDIAVKSVLKDWVTACIIERKQEGRREELINTQAELNEMELFYKWIKTQK